MHRILSLTTFFLLPLSAEPALVLTDAMLPQRIHAQNPELRAARLKIEEALGKWQQAGKPARPRLDVEWEHDANLREGEIRIGVSRSFPLTDRLNWEKEISKAKVEAAEMEVRQIEQEILTEARLLFVRALAIKNRRQSMNLDQQEAATFAKTIKEQLSSAEASALDAAQAQLDAATLIIEQKQLDAEEVQILGELKKLLGMPHSSTIAVGGDLPPLHNAQSGNPQNRADYQKALYEIDRARSTVEKEKSSRIDDMEAGIFASGMRREDAPEGFGNDLMVGLQFSIPLPFGDDNSGNIAAAQATLQRRQLESQAILAGARHDANTANAEMREWKSLDEKITTELMPLAEQQLRLSQQAHDQGQGELANIFRARAQKRLLTRAQIDARSSYHQARIRLQASLGKP